MARLGIDVSAVKSPFDPIPEGNYQAKVTKAELTQSKKGAAMIALEYEIVGQPEIAGQRSLNGRKLFNYAVLDNTGGQFLVNQHAVAAGDDPSNPDPDLWVGSDVDVEVTVEEGDRGPQNRTRLLVDVTSRESYGDQLPEDEEAYR